MNRRGAVVAAALAFLGGCRGVGDDLADVRAEIERLERSIPPEAPLWISEGPDAFEPFLEDFTGRIPDFVYNHVAAKLAGRRGGGERSEGLFSPAEALANPARHRGRFWTVRGTVAHLEPQPVGDRRLGFDAAFSGALIVDDRPVLFHVVEKPDVVRIGEDTVEMEAVFLKILRYVARDGRRIDAPFLMARRLAKYY